MSDTSALVAIERAAKSSEPALCTLGNEPAAIPAIVCAELMTGVPSAGRSCSRP